MGNSARQDASSLLAQATVKKTGENRHAPVPPGKFKVTAEIVASVQHVQQAEQHGRDNHTPAKFSSENPPRAAKGKVDTGLNVAAKEGLLPEARAEKCPRRRRSHLGNRPMKMESDYDRQQQKAEDQREAENRRDMVQKPSLMPKNQNHDPGAGQVRCRSNQSFSHAQARRVGMVWQQDDHEHKSGDGQQSGQQPNGQIGARVFESQPVFLKIPS